MGFYDTYKAVFEGAQSVLEKLTDINEVASGERFKVGDLPMVVLDPSVTPIKKGAVGGRLQLALRFTVFVIVQATEPEDWLTEIVKPMGSVVDQIIANKTLEGSALDTFPRNFNPRILNIMGRDYYGGAIEFEATLFYLSV